MSLPAFSSFTLMGVDAQKFLQGQVTLNVEKLTEGTTRYTGICSLKGRIQYGFWLKKINAESFEIISPANLAEALSKHIKKFGAFSKMKLEEAGTVYPTIEGIHTVFGSAETNIEAWQLQAIESGQSWIEANTSELFQPQELRLHQREGVHYDKGCYLGQEIVARLWFKAKPKSWLHLVQGTGDVPASATQLSPNTTVVNSIGVDGGYKALVVAKPEVLVELGLTVLDLPEALNGEVARPQS